MRKYTIPKAAYISLVILLLTVCVGYTYAYFSSYYDTETNPEMGYVEVVWYNTDFDPINDGDNSIAIGANKLASDSYSKILALAEDNSTEEITLQIGNGYATVPSYCRIGISASYKPSGATEFKPCGEQWVQLAYKGENAKESLLTSMGWFYHDGYYYYGNGSTKELTEFWSDYAEETITVADHLYLSPTVSADIFGAEVKIVLTAEVIQTTNGALGDPAGWGVNW